MTCLGEIRSPLEASVQELCNARLVEVMRTWTMESLQSPPCELGLQSASERTSADVDAPPATSEECVGPEGQGRSGQLEPCRTDFPDAPSVAVYYGNEEEVRRGFLIALRAMGVAVVEQSHEPAKPPVSGAKP
jgi:hypothetical protein